MPENAKNAQIDFHKDPKTQRFKGCRMESSKFATLVYGHAGKPKVLNYSVAALVKNGAFWTALRTSGTIFTMDNSVWVSLAMYMVIAGVCGGATWFVADDIDYTKLEAVSNYLNMFIPFILGLYVSLALTRWWELRINGIGKVLDAAQNVILISVALLPSAEFQEWHDQVLKYALSSISLIVQTVRDKDNVKSMGPEGEGLLTAEEVELLKDMPIRPRPAVMWSWICALCTRVMEEQGIPPGKHRDVIAECVKARDGISLIWTYLGTQLPFAYVHLVTFLVNLNNLVMAIKCGVVFAVTMKNKNYIHASSQLVFIWVVPVLYQGLLSVSYIIHDPFGEDMLDFPVMAFQEYMNEQCVTLSQFSHACPARQQEYGPAPTVRALSLRKGMGRLVADEEQNSFDRKQDGGGTNGNGEAVEDTDGELVESPLLGSLREQMRVKDELITSLQQQNQLLESTVSVVNNRMRSLESSQPRLPPHQLPSAPERATWCSAPTTGTDRVRLADMSVNRPPGS